MKPEEQLARIIARALGRNDESGRHWQRYVAAARLILKECRVIFPGTQTINSSATAARPQDSGGSFLGGIMNFQNGERTERTMLVTIAEIEDRAKALRDASMKIAEIMDDEPATPAIRNLREWLDMLGEQRDRP